MEFIADFHVHSCYSRATARNMNLENLYTAAQVKGIKVIGTGDFTHPAWLSELKRKLVLQQNGLFALRSDIARVCDQKVPRSCRSRVFFMLTAEISNIYKKNGKTRKNHHLIFVPDLETASRMGTKLSTVGNIKSDGRPILGLDARNLLELLLESTNRGLLVPAHIWTPWFSLLGSKSGFDSVNQCFEDLTPYIYALETGLSSDPSMNRKVSDLDRFTLISNSDAHSPMNLAREANVFKTDLSYHAIIESIKSGDPDHFAGTLEFYPEEGKYHYDGHRKCGIVFDPGQTRVHHDRCPVCRKPLTLGVLNRVNQLADRVVEDKRPRRPSVSYVVPLSDLLSEIFGVGPRSKKIFTEYQSVIEKLGPELHVLCKSTLMEIEKKGSAVLAEAIRRMREKKVHIQPGYDGKYGRIRMYTDKELNR